ncbi:MAG: glycosyltransferase family 1 protein [Acidobacteriota bacterium]
MRLGIDARVLAHRPTGVARYLGALLAHLPALMPGGAESVLLADRPLDARWRASATRVETLRWPLPGGDPAWRQVRLAARLWRPPRFDALFCPFYTVPLAAPGRFVVTLHDVAFAAHPAWFDRRGRWAFRLAGPSARRAAAVLTPSRFSAGEIVRRFGVPPAKVHVTPLGVDTERFATVDAAARSALRAWLGFAGPYLLHLGAVHARRLPDVLVRAFAHLAPRHPDLRLVIAGPDLDPRPDLAALARELEIGNRVVRRTWVPEEHLPALLGGAEVVCYLSEYEGFGLPLLEALAAGAPVLALRRASLPEVAGEAALWVDQPDPGHIAARLDELLRDERSRRQLADAGPRQAARFPWRETARATWEVIERVVRG